MRSREEIITLVEKIVVYQDKICHQHYSKLESSVYYFHNALKGSLTSALYLLRSRVPLSDVVLSARIVLDASKDHMGEYVTEVMRGHLTGCVIAINLCGGKQKIPAPSSSRLCVRYRG